MAVDKLVDSTQLDADLTSVANAIRTKGGTSASLAFPAGFVSAVEAIPTGGGGIEKVEFSITSSDWGNYGITSSSGSVGSNAIRILVTFAEPVLSVSVPSGYNVALFAYQLANSQSGPYLANTYIGGWTGAQWQKSLTWHTSIDLPDIPYNYVLKFVMRKANDEEISPSDGNNAIFTKYAEVA